MGGLRRDNGAMAQMAFFSKRPTRDASDKMTPRADGVKSLG